SWTSSPHAPRVSPPRSPTSNWQPKPVRPVGSRCRRALGPEPASCVGSGRPAGGVTHHVDGGLDQTLDRPRLIAGAADFVPEVVEVAEAGQVALGSMGVAGEQHPVT